MSLVNHLLPIEH